MPDNGLQHGRIGRVQKVLVIGAGVSGLVAAKVMRGRGHDVHVVERNGDLGGVSTPVMISIQTPAPDLNSARTNAAKITSQGHNCQAVPAGRIPCIRVGADVILVALRRVMAAVGR